MSSLSLCVCVPGAAAVLCLFVTMLLVWPLTNELSPSSHARLKLLFANFPRHKKTVIYRFALKGEVKKQLAFQMSVRKIKLSFSPALILTRERARLARSLFGSKSGI